MTIKVLYEDNHLLAVEKPVNMPVQRDISNDADLLSIMKRYVGEKYNKPGNVFLGLVHRLDRPVGGVMVFARTSKAASRLSKQIREKKMQKIYLAVTRGGFDSIEETWDDYLLKDRDQNIVKVVEDEKAGAKQAVLHYRVVDQKRDFALVEIKLETGRPHQIRVQFAARGHSIIGDKKYGVDLPGQTGNIALWAFSLAFKHPVRDEMIRITDMPPFIKPWDLFSDKLQLYK